MAIEIKRFFTIWFNNDEQLPRGLDRDDLDLGKVVIEVNSGIATCSNPCGGKGDIRNSRPDGNILCNAACLDGTAARSSHPFTRPSLLAKCGMVDTPSVTS